MPTLPAIPQHVLAIVGGVLASIALIAAVLSGNAGSSSTPDPPDTDGVHVVVTNPLGMPARGCLVNATWNATEIVKRMNDLGVYTFPRPDASVSGEQTITVDCLGLFSGKRTITIPTPTEPRTVVPVKF